MAVIAMLVGTALSAHGQQFNEAATVPFGSFDFIPTLDVGFRYDDNVTRQASDEIASFTQIISPQLILLNNFGASQARFGYRLRNERFFSSSEDNYTDHFLSTGVEYELNVRHRLDVSFDFEDGHEQRGTGFSILNIADSPDTYKETDLALQYSYGAPGAAGRLDFNANLASRDYDLNTLPGRARDRGINSVGGTFYYRVGATTDATFDIIRKVVNYNVAADPSNPLDSTVMSYLVGLSWEATAQTSGFAKIGHEEKDFDSSLRDDFSGVDWSAGVTWEPTDNSEVTLSTNNDTNETNGEGNFIRQRDYRLVWNHRWLERLRTSASITFSEDKYEGQAVEFGVREDDLQQFNATAYYQFRRWINFELGYTFDTRDSNRDGIDFDRNQLLLNAFITL